MSKRQVRGGELGELLRHLAELQRKGMVRTGKMYPVITIQEAVLDGFWLHRALQQEGIESHVVDAASIAVSRQRRRAKTDRIDGEALVRVLLAYKRGEPRVCAMVVALSPEAEDERRVSRERQVLLAERVAHVNRIKGLLFAQGILEYAPLRRDRRACLERLRTGDGRALPAHVKAQIGRELGRLELLLDQIKAVEAERDRLLAKAAASDRSPSSQGQKMLLTLKGIGPQIAAVLWSEGLNRQFANRRKLAAFAGLAATPWRSGAIIHEQGVSKAGNPRLRTAMIELAWLWRRHQPHSELSRWFKRQGQRNRKSAIVALARKLLVALWKYVSSGVLIEGAVLKPAA